MSNCALSVKLCFNTIGGTLNVFRKFQANGTSLNHMEENPTLQICWAFAVFAPYFRHRLTNFYFSWLLKTIFHMHFYELKKYLFFIRILYVECNLLWKSKRSTSSFMHANENRDAYFYCLSRWKFCQRGRSRRKHTCSHFTSKLYVKLSCAN